MPTYNYLTELVPVGQNTRRFVGFSLSLAVAMTVINLIIAPGTAVTNMVILGIVLFIAQWQCRQHNLKVTDFGRPLRGNVATFVRSLPELRFARAAVVLALIWSVIVMLQGISMLFELIF